MAAFCSASFLLRPQAAGYWCRPMTAEILTLRGAIEHLPTEQRQVIELKYLVGMTNEEVAAAMGTTPGAVNAKQWRALKALADVLEERA